MRAVFGMAYMHVSTLELSRFVAYGMVYMPGFYYSLFGLSHSWDGIHGWLSSRRLVRLGVRSIWVSLHGCQIELEVCRVLSKGWHIWMA